jgi:hypothetical protein
VDYETALRLMPPEAAQLVGQVIPIAEVPTALPDLLFRGPSHVVCALIDWRAGRPSR